MGAKSTERRRMDVVSRQAMQRELFYDYCLQIQIEGMVFGLGNKGMNGDSALSLNILKILNDFVRVYLTSTIFQSHLIFLKSLIFLMSLLLNIFRFFQKTRLPDMKSFLFSKIARLSNQQWKHTLEILS